MRITLQLALLLPTSLFGTPDDGIRIYEVLLGYNSNSYYSIQTKHYPTGLYYERIDSSFVIQRDLSDGRITEQILLRATTHKDRSTLEDWETNEYLNTEFNYANYLIDKEIIYLYPEIYSNNHYRPYRMDIEENGLLTHYRDDYAQVLDIDVIEVFIPSIKETLEIQRKDRERFPRSKIEYVKIQDFIGDSKYLFFIIESILEPEYYQSIVVCRAEDFDESRQALINRNKM